MVFKLKSSFWPTGDQPEAIEKLFYGIKKGFKHQVLLGVTGSGKTFTMANLIARLNWPALVISHNKTLVAQLYQEFRDFFPENAVSYFVSYYDFYQPEAYLPQTDTYIEKETQINDLIDKLRLKATTNLLTREDTLIVASVSSIYNIGSPKDYRNIVLTIKPNEKINRHGLFLKLNKLQYNRSDYDFKRGTFRVRGETVDIYPAYEDFGWRLYVENELIAKIEKIDPLTGKILAKAPEEKEIFIYPAKHFLTDSQNNKEIFSLIRADLKKQTEKFKKEGKIIEAERLERRVNYDLEMIEETGYVNGIENYSRYFDGRMAGDPPFSLLDYYEERYGKKWLLIIDESHMTIPQIKGMYEGDRSRKETLVEFGFRLPAALDNRPLKFSEFLQKIPFAVYTSATPAEWEISLSQNRVVEQLIRPTGLPDPAIAVKPTKNQIDDLIAEIKNTVNRKERVLVTTLTKRTAEDLAGFLHESGIKVTYLHSEIETLERSDILDDLRSGKYDVLVGINLLREGLDLPEVSLVAILDADKEGFLRSETSLIQVMGRAARHLNGRVIMYADNITESMKRAINEVERRRKRQLEYNRKNKITPKSIEKPIRQKLIFREKKPEKVFWLDQEIYYNLKMIKPESLTPEERLKTIKNLQKEMKIAARDLNFEQAAIFRDKILELKKAELS